MVSTLLQLTLEVIIAPEGVVMHQHDVAQLYLTDTTRQTNNPTESVCHPVVLNVSTKHYTVLVLASKFLTIYRLY